MELQPCLPHHLIMHRKVALSPLIYQKIILSTKLAVNEVKKVLLKYWCKIYYFCNFVNNKCWRGVLEDVQDTKQCSLLRKTFSQAIKELFIDFKSL